MKAVIRIKGQVGVKKDVAETLFRLSLRKKLNCVFIDEKDIVRMGMLKKVKDFVAFGDVKDELIKKVVDVRGEKDKDKKYRGFCRLHPPRGGFKKSTKVGYPKGILGKHEDIAKLLERML